MKIEYKTDIANQSLQAMLDEADLLYRQMVTCIPAPEKSDTNDILLQRINIKWVAIEKRGEMRRKAYESASNIEAVQRSMAANVVNILGDK